MFAHEKEEGNEGGGGGSGGGDGDDSRPTTPPLPPHLLEKEGAATDDQPTATTSPSEGDIAKPSSGSDNADSTDDVPGSAIATQTTPSLNKSQGDGNSGSGGGGTSSSSSSTSSSFPSVVHKDAFLLFRALCRLSMKQLEPQGVLPWCDNTCANSVALSLFLSLPSQAPAPMPSSLV